MRGLASLSILGAISCELLVSGSPFRVMVLPEMCSRLWVLTPRLLDITVRLLLLRQLRRQLPSLCVIGENWIDYTGGVLCSATRGFSGTRCQVHCMLAAGFNGTAPIPYWIVTYSWSFSGAGDFFCGHVGEHVWCFDATVLRSSGGAN